MVQLLGRGSKTPISGARDERIFAIAAAQRNRVARRQLLAAGISSNTIDRLARTSLLRHVHCGVFAVGPGASIPLADETAALLAVRAGATLSHHTRSVAEERFLSLIRDSGLPQPLVNVRRHGYEIDFFWPEERVAVEVDGFAYHRTRGRFEGDRSRDAALRKAGITVIRVTWRQLERDATAVLVDVAQALVRTAR